MKGKSFAVAIVAFVGLGVILYACTEKVSSQPSFIFKSAPKEGIVAKIVDKEVTQEELYKGIENQVYEAEKKLYEVKMNHLQGLILEKFMEMDPRKKGLSNDQYLEKYIVAAKQPSKKEIEAFIQERKIPTKHVTKQMEERVKQFLAMESKKMAVERWLVEQSQKHQVEIYLSKPERPVAKVEEGNSPFKGGADAKVTVFEFTDFQCPFCSRGAEVMKELKAKYKNKIKVVFKNFPLPFHGSAKQAAHAAFCAHEQDTKYFWQLYEEFFADQANLNEKGIEETVKKTGLDVEKYQTCMKSKKYDKKIEDDMEEGKKAGVNSTPTFFVNGQMLVGAQPVEEFVEIIEEELKK